nr:MAG TPA: hypothetical protein [Caudoviricetes sp.]
MVGTLWAVPAAGGWVRVDGHRLTHWRTGWGRRSNMAR